MVSCVAVGLIAIMLREAIWSALMGWLLTDDAELRTPRRVALARAGPVGAFSRRQRCVPKR
jgi:hypothetical protein